MAERAQPGLSAAGSTSAVPRHLAVVMDGNGRWARNRHRPRGFGHRAGVRAARSLVESCHRRGIAHLTLFAFSQENWQRPGEEVGLLMQLLTMTLQREVQSLHRNRVRMDFIGDRETFGPGLRRQMEEAEALTTANEGLRLHVAAGYGGRWDIARAARSLCAEGRPIDIAALESRLSAAAAPHPDLLIRTGGERRLSNFMLWQLAYTELYFTDTLWPDFDDAALAAALAWYAGRERRFGRVGATVRSPS